MKATKGKHQEVERIPEVEKCDEGVEVKSEVAEGDDWRKFVDRVIGYCMDRRGKCCLQVGICKE